MHFIFNKWNASIASGVILTGWFFRGPINVESSETGELLCDSLNSTDFISRSHMKDGRTRSSRQGWEEGLREQLPGTAAI